MLYFASRVRVQTETKSHIHRTNRFSLYICLCLIVVQPQRYRESASGKIHKMSLQQPSEHYVLHLDHRSRATLTGRIANTPKWYKWICQEPNWLHSHTGGCDSALFRHRNALWTWGWIWQRSKRPKCDDLLTLPLRRIVESYLFEMMSWQTRNALLTLVVSQLYLLNRRQRFSVTRWKTPRPRSITCITWYMMMMMATLICT